MPKLQGIPKRQEHSLDSVFANMLKKRMYADKVDDARENSVSSLMRRILSRP